MKKTIIIVLIINFACLLKLYCQTQMYDIFTPMGSAVRTFLTNEASIAERTFFDGSYGMQHPNAIQITVYDHLSSTRKFNCHGYAWLRVEQGIDRWIGWYVPNDEDIYMQDGSYVEVPEETYPGKISWIGSDHSGVTTERPGWFISKWNMFPLFLHRWNDSPFGTNFKFYVKNCSVFGYENVNFRNQTVTSNTNIFLCGDINIQNVTVQAGATLKLDAKSKIIINSGYTVENGATLIIK